MEHKNLLLLALNFEQVQPDGQTYRIGPSEIREADEEREREIGCRKVLFGGAGVSIGRTFKLAFSLAIFSKL